MFVERLKKEDFAKFILDDKYIESEYKAFGETIVDAISEFEVENGRVTFSVGRVDFLFTDFDCLNNYVFRSYNGSHNKDWLAFMYQKFGTEFKHEFYKYRTQEKRRMMKFVSARFDAENAIYEKTFEESRESEC